MTADNNLNHRREEAQAAMESDAHRAARAKKEQELARQRHQARLAMEDEQHRHAREAAEKEERERQTVMQRAAQEAKRQADVKRLQAEAALAEKQRQAAERAQLKDAQSEHITSSEKLIDQLKQAGNVILSPLRTFKTDMAKAVQESGLSATRMAIAEQSRQIRQRQDGAAVTVEPEKTSHWGLWLLLIIFLLGGGVFAGAYWFKWDLTQFIPATLRAYLPFANTPSALNITTPAAPTATPLFSTETSHAIDATTPNLAAQLAPTGGNAGSFSHLYFYRGEQVLDFTAVRQALNLSWPDTLTRILNEQFMLGNFNLTADSDHRFIILKPKFFEQAFNGMLNWEGKMADDLAPLLGATSPRAERETSFTDTIFRNKDVRLLKNTAGETILLYSFLDADTIVITKDKETFVELFKRFVTSN